MKQDLAERMANYMAKHDEWVPKRILIELARMAIYRPEEIEEAFATLDSAGEKKGYTFVNIGMLREPSKDIKYRFYNMTEEEKKVARDAALAFDSF